jgi:RNA polymerase sigma-70 factor (ECF subfamily)
MEFQAEDIEGLRRAGFTEPQILEVVLLIGYGDLFNTLQFGTGAEPDFAVRPIPEWTEKILHPEPEESRLLDVEIEDDPDAAEVARAQAGDLGAFEILVERHTQRIYRTLIGLLGNPEDAKDAVQDTFLKAFQNLSRFERRAKFATWLVSIASNTGVQRLRDRKQFESIDDDGSDQEEFRPKQVRAWGDDPEEMYSKTQQRDLLERAISRLPAKYRVVLLLRDVQQLPTEDAAAALALSVPALKARLLRGRLILRETLAPHFSAEAQSA